MNLVFFIIIFLFNCSRPTPISPEEEERLYELSRQNWNVTEESEFIGLERGSWYKIVKDDELIKEIAQKKTQNIIKEIKYINNEEKERLLEIYKEIINEFVLKFQNRINSENISNSFFLHIKTLEEKISDFTYVTLTNFIFNFVDTMILLLKDNYENNKILIDYLEQARTKLETNIIPFNYKILSKYHDKVESLIKNKEFEELERIIYDSQVYIIENFFGSILTCSAKILRRNIIPNIFLLMGEINNERTDVTNLTKNDSKINFEIRDNKLYYEGFLLKVRKVKDVWYEWDRRMSPISKH